MAPEQCPACGRFLSRAFVAEATPGPQPCPRCGEPVSFARAATEAPPEEPAVAPDEPPAPPDTDADAHDVGDAVDHASRAVTDDPDGHPLDTWGSGATAPPLTDEPAMALTPEELALAGGGALFGALVVRRSRLLGALVGAIAAIASLLARRR